MIICRSVAGCADAHGRSGGSDIQMQQTNRAQRTLLDMGRYQWLVLFAAWLGWGFDIFDGLLFSFVAPNCVPTLLHIPLGTPEAKAATADWNGILTSLLLIGWAIGGILFGRVADRIGRTKTLMLTMLLYSLGTAACAFAVNMPMLIFFRLVISLGIGGEWAAGAAMVAEVALMVETMSRSFSIASLKFTAIARYSSGMSSDMR